MSARTYAKQSSGHHLESSFHFWSKGVCYTNSPKFSDFNGLTNTCVHKIHTFILYCIFFFMKLFNEAVRKTVSPSSSLRNNIFQHKCFKKSLLQDFLAFKLYKSYEERFPSLGNYPLVGHFLVKPERPFPFLMALQKLWQTFPLFGKLHLSGALQ